MTLHMSSMSLQVQLERFEGPLALLLHLIREQEMNIFDIDISKITSQYLEYIKTMRSLDLENAGDFVAMAATLIQIKSRMLLPQYNEEGEEIEVDDPRKELVNRLLEYQSFQEASKRLLERPWVGRDVWLRGERLDFSKPQNDEIELEENPLFSLISSYRRVVRSMKTGVHRVVAAMQSIADRILEMKDFLKVGQRVEFTQLINAEGEKKQGQVLVTFLSLLELAKIGFVSLFQTETYGQIHIESLKVIERDVVSQVENYENVNGQKLDEQVLAESISTPAPETEEEAMIPQGGGEEADAFIPEMASDDEIEAEELRMLAESQSSGEVTV